jgi:hypothetical protein
VSTAVDRIKETLTELSIELGVNEDSDEFREAVERLSQLTARQFGVFEMPVKPRRAVLTVQKVKEMKALYAEGQGEVTQAELVEQFGVSTSTVSRILAGKMWGHVQ